MAITDDVRKTLTDPTPLYFVAGTADLAAQKLKEVPTLVEKIVAEAPERFNQVRNTDPKAVQDRVTQQAKDAQGKLNEVLGSLDTDLKRLRDSAQDLALQGVGRAAELAVKARERYDEVAEHGQEVVKTWRGEAADEVVDIASAIEPHEEGAPKAPSQPVAVDSTKPAAAKPAAKEAPKTSAKPATPAKKAPARKPATAKKPDSKPSH
ncbi:hypothetical protein [Streptomyces botrytidirepellens]|uniref:Heparin binding hemagglutinin HbhA n=1 Tax=Streptomyces botrytidirepellens TaxID=2486417 RepID=A0A3M8T463_9ACTN|nr:hypothetical protein [Streptomyces botrytidirepellens]RNF85512.1 hypothetical protein EEJ42_43650 [Streptomyces botrytidirepellens]